MAACTSSAATTRPSTSTSIACGGSTLVRTNFIQLLVLRVFAFKTATLPSKSAKFRAKPRTVITTGVRGIFSGGGGEIMDFSRWESAAAAFHFTHSKLREQPFLRKILIGKYQIWKSKGASSHMDPSPVISIQTLATRTQHRYHSYTS